MFCSVSSSCAPSWSWTCSSPSSWTTSTISPGTSSVEQFFPFSLQFLIKGALSHDLILSPLIFFYQKYLCLNIFLRWRIYKEIIDIFTQKNGTLYSWKQSFSAQIRGTRFGNHVFFRIWHLCKQKKLENSRHCFFNLLGLLWKELVTEGITEFNSFQKRDNVKETVSWDFQPF